MNLKKGLLVVMFKDKKNPFSDKFEKSLNFKYFYLLPFKIYGFPMYVIQGVLFPQPAVQGSLVPGDTKYFKKIYLVTSPERYSMNINIKTKACFFNIRGERTTDRDIWGGVRDTGVQQFSI